MRSRVRFPNPREAGEDGLLCIGGDLSVETLYEAYRLGVFPWPQEGMPLLWFCPPERGILEFKDLHWPRRFLQEMKASRFSITFDRAFAGVVRECALVPRAHEKGTWILPEMQTAYVRFHEVGFAHSVECWLDDRLVGGLYGVFIEGVFSGESMFFHETNASKICLYHLVEKLRSAGLEWMDIQMVTPVLKTFGGKYISRDEYLTKVAKAQAAPISVQFSGEEN